MAVKSATPKHNMAHLVDAMDIRVGELEIRDEVKKGKAKKKGQKAAHGPAIHEVVLGESAAGEARS